MAVRMTVNQKVTTGHDGVEHREPLSAIGSSVNCTTTTETYRGDSQNWNHHLTQEAGYWVYNEIILSKRHLCRHVLYSTIQDHE